MNLKYKKGTIQWIDLVMFYVLAHFNFCIYTNGYGAEINKTFSKKQFHLTTKFAEGYWFFCRNTDEVKKKKQNIRDRQHNDNKNMHRVSWMFLSGLCENQWPRVVNKGEYFSKTYCVVECKYLWMLLSYYFSSTFLSFSFVFFICFSRVNEQLERYKKPRSVSWSLLPPPPSSLPL